MPARICPANGRVCFCAASFCPQEELEIADGRRGQWALNAADRKEPAKRRLFDLEEGE